MPNKALHLTAFPLRSKAAGELGRWTNDDCVIRRVILMSFKLFYVLFKSPYFKGFGGVF